LICPFSHINKVLISIEYFHTNALINFSQDLGDETLKGIDKKKVEEKNGAHILISYIKKCVGVLG
jgi:hypothetical protein